MRGLIARGLIAALLGVPPAVGAAVPCLVPPLDAPVVDPFRGPDCPYCAGNRGLEYATADGTTVVAAAAGTVTFAGLVAGVRYVVVEHANAYRTTYGKLGSATVRAGDRIAAGARVGTTTGSFFFGLREGEVYLDPAPALASVVRRPQLVPLDGRNRRPPRPSRLICP